MTRELRRYLRLFRDGRKLLATSLLISLAEAAVLTPIPLVIKHVFDVDLHRGKANEVVLGGAVVLALYLAGSAFALRSRYTVLKATKRAIAQLRSELVAKLFALPKSFHDGSDLGRLHATIVQDSERLDVVANATAGQMLPAAVVACGLAVVALVLNPVLFAVLACACPAMVLVKRRRGGRVRERTRVWQRAFDRFSADTQLALRARTLIEVRGADRLERERLSRQAAELSEAGLEMAWRQGALSITQGAVAAVAAVLVLVIGGSEVANGRLTAGDLLAFYAIVALLQAQVSTIVTVVPLAISGRESLDRLSEFLDLHQPAPYQGTRRISFTGGIELRDVSFGYGEAPLLEGIDLAVSPGEHFVILGPNGSGKSTLASLVPGVYRPWSGALEADGIPYDQLDLRTLRSTFGVVLQDPVILPGTIADNIAYGRPAATFEEIRHAAAAAGAADFIERLPGGYQARAGHEGTLLSGGQRQRVALARALLGDPRLLILDEPTTHLDAGAIAELAAVLGYLPHRPTVITITHDDAIAAHADRVVGLRDGRIVPLALASISRPLA